MSFKTETRFIIFKLQKYFDPTITQPPPPKNIELSFRSNYIIYQSTSV